ncbi:MAG TPA: ABC transporter permease [Bacteroidia bacterium]
MFKITRNDLKLFIADKRALLLTFLLPIALITLFALAFGGVGGNNESRPYDLLLSDQDNTKESADAITILDSVKTLHLIKQPLAAAQDQVKKGKQTAVLVLHKGFSDSIRSGRKLPMELQYDAAKEMEIGMLQQSLIPNLFRMTGAQGMKHRLMNEVSEKDTAAVQTWFDSIGKLISSKQEAKNKIEVQQNHALPKKDAATEEKNGWDNMMSGIEMTKLVAAKEDNTPGLVQAVAGTAVMMLLFSVTAMGASLLTEKEEGTLKKLLCSPLHPNQILLGKMLSANIISVFQLSVMMIYAWLAFKLNLFLNIPSLIVLILATAFACSSFGLLLASVAKSRQQVQGLSTLIILTMSAVGGSMIPTFIMPEWMQKISVISVNYWSIQGFFDIFWRQLAFTDGTFLMRIAVLFSIGGLLTFISLRLFKKNLLKLY